MEPGVGAGREEDSADCWDVVNALCTGGGKELGGWAGGWRVLDRLASPQTSSVEALTPIVTIFGERAFKELRLNEVIREGP